MRTFQTPNANVVGRPFFDWRITPHTTVSKHAKMFDVTHCCNKYTSKMAAVAVVNRMT